MDSNKQAIIQTLLYSDIFDFPLTEDEIFKFLISPKPVVKKVIVQNLAKLSKEVAEKDGLWFLAGRKQIVQLRRNREQYAKEKIKKARHIARLLSIIPTIQLIGVSGGLSMLNVESNDDIDLFIITKAQKLWTTRFLALSLLKTMRLLRTKNDTKVENKACLNMFIDEQALTFPQERQDIYTAHEIVQVIPLFERNNIYQRFIVANRWIKEHMYNAIDIRILRYKPACRRGRDTKKILPNIFELITKYIQLTYMKRHRTNETISDHILAFHPSDYRKQVLREYNKRLRYAKI